MPVYEFGRPRPGRVFAASRSHSFAQFADAIGPGVCPLDPAHMHRFTLADQTQITPLDLWDGGAHEGSIDSDRARLGRLGGGAQFACLFDFAPVRTIAPAAFASTCVRVAGQSISPPAAPGGRP
ncbi:hypothetical protein [Micromonospora sp. NPDC092111]|uniref:hypothetical protein n=1 Tax=Micromonospora sp. NPDC092111 TaxID=3364289 RepID=UPI0037FF43B8